MFSQFYLSFEVGENSVVDISSVKRKLSISQNTGLKLEELEKKFYQSVFSPWRSEQPQNAKFCTKTV